MRARSFIHGFKALAGTAFFAATLLGSNGLAEATEVIRFSTHVNEQDFRYRVWQHYKKLVEEGTNGRIKVQIFPSSTLHPFTKAIDALLGGVADIATVAGGAIDDRLPCAQVTHFMPAYVDQDRIYDLHRAYNDLMKDEFEKVGLEVLFSFDIGYDQEWFFVDPPQKLDELNGRLVRSVGPFTTHIIETFGGKPVFIAPTETYQAAERGVVNALSMGAATVSAWNMWEVMPHMVHASLFYGNIMYPMPKSKLETFSPEDQKVLREAGKAMQDWAQPRYEQWINEQVGEAVMKKNASVVSLPREESIRLVKKAREGWMEKVERACGPEKTSEVLKLFDEFSG